MTRQPLKFRRLVLTADGSQIFFSSTINFVLAEEAEPSSNPFEPDGASQ